VAIEQGQFVRPGDPLVTITDVDKVEIPISITLGDFAKIKPRLDSGTLPPVALASNESAPELWTGELLRASPKVDPATRTVVVYVRVDNARQSTPLLPGTFVQARIEGPVHQEVLVVPRDALIGSDVYVAHDTATAERRAVTIDERLQAFAIVSEGIEEGDRVVLSNLDVLNTGSLIQPQRERTLDQELKEQRAKLLSRLDEPKDRLTKKPSE
jgi:membrane fusion protein (multidrug efflux system)